MRLLFQLFLLLVCSIGFNFVSRACTMERHVQIPYGVNDYVKMVEVFFLCNGNLHQAAQLYRERWPDRRHPHRHTIAEAHRRFTETGSVLPQRHDAGRPRDVLLPAVEEHIEQLFENDPTTSTREVARQVGLHHSQVHAVVKEAGKHPYHYRRVQELLPGDYPRRVNFCGGLLAQVRVNPEFLNDILFSDECTFTKTGMMNQHNYHFWAEENPRLTRVTSTQYRWSINVWAGMINGQLIGPVYLPPRLNGAAYLQFLRETLPQLLEGVPLGVRERMIFQHDGAPPHFTRAVREHLDQVYPDRWIGRAGPVEWPARSPDLTPLDYFLWGYIKEMVYRHPLQDEEECRRRIDEAFASVGQDADMLFRATGNLTRRANLVLERDGRHIEQFL